MARCRPVVTLLVSISALLGSAFAPQVARACTPGCVGPSPGPYPMEQVSTAGVIYLAEVEAPLIGHCYRRASLRVRDDTGERVSGQTVDGVWRTSEPLTAGASYEVELWLDGTLSDTFAVVAVELDEAPVIPAITASAREIERGCGWSCCPASDRVESSDTAWVFERGDTFYDDCQADDGSCSLSCSSYCGTTRLAIMPQVDLRWVAPDSLVDAYTFYEVYKGTTTGGEPLLVMPPWTATATFGSVDPVTTQTPSERVLSFAGFLPGEPLCLTLVATNAVATESVATPVTVCVDDEDVARVAPRVPDLESMREHCKALPTDSVRDLSQWNSTTPAVEVARAWCGATVVEPPRTTLDQGGCTVSPMAPARRCPWFVWIACALAGLIVIPRRLRRHAHYVAHRHARHVAVAGQSVTRRGHTGASSHERGLHVPMRSLAGVTPGVDDTDTSERGTIVQTYDLRIRAGAPGESRPPAHADVRDPSPARDLVAPRRDVVAVELRQVVVAAGAGHDLHQLDGRPQKTRQWLRRALDVDALSQLGLLRGHAAGTVVVGTLMWS